MQAKTNDMNSRKEIYVSGIKRINASVIFLST